MTSEGPYLKKLGKRLQQLRKEKGVTQDEIALETGIARNFLSEIENGHANPSIYTVKRLLGYLKLPFSALD